MFPKSALAGAAALTALAVALVAPLPVSPATASSRAASADTARYREWIESMKASPRGPFERIRWFCADGEVLPPKPYACVEHGGGVQHGEWTEEAVALREAGYSVANVLARLDPDDFVGETADLAALSELLVERYLIDADEGWIFRGAASYRGALQAEDEEAGARRLIVSMLDDPAWRASERFLLIRETVRLLPLGTDEADAAEVRRLALQITGKDPDFMGLRIKIHGMPDAGDAELVRAYAKQRGAESMMEDYAGLAGSIDALYATGNAARRLRELADGVDSELIRRSLLSVATRLEADSTPAAVLETAGGELSALRDRVQSGGLSGDALAMLTAGVALEDDVYAAVNTLRANLAGASRAERLEWFEHATRALYGLGLLSRRQIASVGASLMRIASARPLTLGTYSDELGYLSRVSDWAAGALHLEFGEAVAKLGELDGLAGRFTQDRLRGSPALIAGRRFDTVAKDSRAVAGVEHELFG